MLALCEAWPLALHLLLCCTVTCFFLSSEAGPMTAGTEGPRCLMAAGRDTMPSQHWTRC